MAAGRVVVRFDQRAVAALIDSPAGPVAQDLLRRGRRVQNEAKRLCPVDRGDLRNSIVVELASDAGRLTVIIGSRLPYAIFVHEGTGVYGPRGVPITARSSTFLRFPVRGMTSARTRAQTADGFVFARSVSGMPGRPFLRNALPAAAG